MESYLNTGLSDLISPDGKIIELIVKDEVSLEVLVEIENILPVFLGFYIDEQQVFFNLKSSLAQLGLNAIGKEYYLDQGRRLARIKVILTAYGPVARAMLKYMEIGMYIGRLFAADDRRLVRNPDYISRMFGRSDHKGTPLLSLGGMEGSDSLVLDKVNGRAIAYLTLQDGITTYADSIYGFLPTLSKALLYNMSSRKFLQLHQQWIPNEPKVVCPEEILLVKTAPLNIKTVFAQVVDELLIQGYKHTTASILQPDTSASGDIYELYGNSNQELTDIPLQFFALEPHREYVFFSDRDQLQTCLEKEATIIDTFKTAPLPQEDQAAVFIVKGEQLLHLNSNMWITRKQRKHVFPGLSHSIRQGIVVDRTIQQQASYPFLKAIAENSITSQGVLFTRYFPSPLIKRMLLSDEVQRCLKGIYFQYPSFSRGEYFSFDDRALLIDLAKFGIPVYWADQATQRVLQYVQRSGRDSGMFVPLGKQETFKRATFFGIYGSNLEAGSFEEELIKLFTGIIEMQKEMNHPLLNVDTNLALVTGGGPGAMEVGNRVATQLKILSCANIVDFRIKGQAIVNEQQQNKYVEAKMTYCLDKIIERQAEFHLDFPIFLTGGIGTDFELALEEVNRKVGSSAPHPILLFGSPEYWEEKISYRFKCNLKAGTIKGSEWVSNCFYCIKTAEEGLEVYRKFFSGTLKIGPGGPVSEKGFIHL